MAGSNCGKAEQEAAAEAQKKKEEAAKKATEEIKKIEALQNGQQPNIIYAPQPQTTQPQVVYVNPSQNAIELQNAQGMPAQTTQQSQPVQQQATAS